MQDKRQKKPKGRLFQMQLRKNRMERRHKQ